MKYFIAVCAFALSALAQQDGQLALGGTVINSKTGEPIRRAMVTATRFAPLREGNPQQGDQLGAIQRFSQSALTDSGGAFHFSGLPPGQYSVIARKPEFTTDFSSGRLLTSVSLSSSTGKLSIKLSPLGVIAGTITDQDGLPLRSVNVTVLSTRIEDGLRQVRSDRSVTTDDRGMYRFWGLMPGRYYVKAAGFGGGTLEFVGDAVPALGDESFAPVYFGGAHTLESATALDIGPGAEAKADLPLMAEAAFAVRGSVTNFAPRHEIKFELLSGTEDVAPTRVALNNDTGRFSITSVVPGSYLLRATQDESTAEAPLTVQSADVDGVTIALAPPLDIPVALRFTNKPPAEKPAGTLPDVALLDDDEPVRIGTCSAKLRPVETGGQRFLFSQPSEPPDTRIVISGVRPGKYRVSIQCFGAYARSATSGTQDLTGSPVLTVAAGVPLAPLEIVATYGGGRISGKLKSDAVTADVTILLVPQFSTPEGPWIAHAFPNPSDPGRLQFRFDSLPPGAYSAWAFPNENVEFRNPEFLRTLSGGVVVQIDPDGEKELILEGVVR